VKVILTGLPHFNRRTAAFLARRGSRRDRYVVVEETSSRRGQLRFLLELVRADAVFAYWGTLRRSRALAIALRLRKRVVQFWAGTDVLDALDAARAGQAYAPLVDGCVHLCESEWTRDELATAGIRARVLPLAALDAPPPASEIGLPETFSVLAYAGAPREDFYRLPELVALARAFPEVPFAICGTDGSSLDGPAPPNVAFLGWVEDVAALYRTATVFVRIPEHDGCSFSVREALAWGRYVVASYPYPQCLVGADRDAIAPHLAALERRHREGTLAPNLAGREFVLAEYDEARVYAGLRPFLAPAR
jgi:hypothetical protein